jgi:hypothetical protein
LRVSFVFMHADFTAIPDKLDFLSKQIAAANVR